MTVREVVQALRDADKIELFFPKCGGVTLYPDSAVMMEAFGDYKVDSISGYRSSDGESGKFNVYDIDIVFVPVKEVTE